MIHDKIKDFEALAAEGVFYSAFKRRTLGRLLGRAEKTIHIENELMGRTSNKITVKEAAVGVFKLHSSLDKPGSLSLIDWFSSARALCSSLRGLHFNKEALALALCLNRILLSLVPEMGDSVDQALAVSYYDVARCHYALYQYEKAIEAGACAVVHHENVAAKKSSRHRCPGCLATVHYHQSSSYDRLENIDEALKSVRISIAMERQAKPDHPKCLSPFRSGQIWFN